jgi:hypothetical protein
MVAGDTSQAPNLPTNAEEMWAHTMGYYKQMPSDMETLLWKVKIFDVFPAKAIINALSFHIDTSSFAPKIADIKKQLERENVQSSGAGLLVVQNEVKRVGAYNSPNVTSPVLRATIELLGGWVSVCAELPDASTNTYEFERYQKRFATAFERAQQEVKVHGATPKLLHGLAVKDAERRDEIKGLPNSTMKEEK